MQRAIVCVALTGLMLAAGCQSSAPEKQAPPLEIKTPERNVSGGVKPAGPMLPVLRPEGAGHAFLVLKDSKGSILAYGNQVQTIDGSMMTITKTFEFKDKSYYEEKVSFRQDKVFWLRRYSLTARGPSFKTEWRVNLDAEKGRYRVETREKDAKDAEVLEGDLQFPTDVYNGMVSTIINNVTHQKKTVVHYVAFTPEPRVVELELSIAGKGQVILGETSQRGMYFIVKPKLGTLVGIGARLTGEFPPDSHVWIVVDGTPGFVRADGPLVPQGPVWRIEYALARWSGDGGD